MNFQEQNFEEEERTLEEEKEEDSILIAYTMRYAFQQSNGEMIDQGEGQGQLRKKGLTILNKNGIIMNIPYSQMIEVNENQYKITIDLLDGEILVLSELGYGYENFYRPLKKLFNEALIKELLMQEKKYEEVEGEYIYLFEDGKEADRGCCEIHLYETGLVIIPDKTVPIRIPYGLITDIQEENYQIFIRTEIEEKYIIKKLGKKFDGFIKIMGEIRQKNARNIQERLKEIFPDLEAAAIRRVTLLIRDGSAIGKTKVDQIDPSLWLKAENYFEQLSKTNAYQYLKLNAQEINIHMGMKQGLMGDLSGIYIWFLIPYYSDNKEEIGNLLFLEAAGDDHGKATYVFRLMDWEFYEGTKDLSVLHAEAEKSICNINYCLNLINFRREPIYVQSQVI